MKFSRGSPSGKDPQNRVLPRGTTRNEIVSTYSVTGKEQDKWTIRIHNHDAGTRKTMKLGH